MIILPLIFVLITLAIGFMIFGLFTVSLSIVLAINAAWAKWGPKIDVRDCLKKGRTQ